MVVRVEQPFGDVSFWTSVKHKDQATCWQHRVIQWIDGYFHLIAQNDQPKWLTILKVISYATLVIPMILLCLRWVLRSIYPLPKETMKVDALIQDTVFIHPKLLMKHSQYLESEDSYVNFAEILLDGQLQITAVLGLPNQEKYVRCKIPAHQILLELVSSPNVANQLQLLFDHSPQGNLPKDFFALLLTPNPEGNAPICSLDHQVLLKILQYAQNNHVVIDPQIVDRLFMTWAGNGHAQLTKTLLSLHPGAIHNRPYGKSLFSRAVIAGSITEISFLLQAMRNQHIFLSPMDTWLYKAYRNNCTFTKEEFGLLSIENQRLVFQIANQYLCPEFLFKLRKIKEELDQVRVVSGPRNADLFSYNMDGIDVAVTLDRFLKDLRVEGLLLTEQEFAPLRDRYEPPRFVSSLNSSSFLSQKMFRMEAARLQLSFVKTQKNIAVIRAQKNNTGHLNMLISMLPNLEIDCPEVFVYSEKITPIARYLTREEMDELIDLIESLGHRFLLNETHLLMGKNTDGEEGLYLIDNVLRPFGDLPEFGKMHLLAHLMDPQDHAWLDGKIRRHKEIFDTFLQGAKPELNRETEFERNEAIIHGFGIKRHLQVPIIRILDPNEDRNARP